jgi:aromatic ring-opening dioxygenase LigB subunit
MNMCVRCGKRKSDAELMVLLSHPPQFSCKDCNQPERSKREDSYTHAEFGCSIPIRFNTSEGIKTMNPRKVCDENLNEIGDAVL